MKRLVCLALVAACSKASDGEPEKKKNPPPKKVEPRPPTDDPEKGEFTLEEATKGLAPEGALHAEITTDHGTIDCELLPQSAPQTVASFVGLARGLRPWQDPRTGEWRTGVPYFEDVAFHRVMPDFMIQGGDPVSAPSYADPSIGSNGPGYTLPDEIDAKLRFDKPGRMAMANTGPGTHSGGSQFFITEGPTPDLNGGYVIFGQCGNIDVVARIARVDVDSPRHAKPLNPIRMKVRIYKK